MPDSSEHHSPSKPVALTTVIGGESSHPFHPDRPRVLLAIDQLSQTLGGGERVLLKTAQELPKYGFDVAILALAVHLQSAIFRLPITCPVYELPVQRTWSPASFSAALELRRFLRSQRFAIVQTFFESSDLWVGPIAKLLAGTKLIWSRRDMGILRQGKHHAAYRLMARMPDKVFAVSEQVRRYSIEVDSIHPDDVETVYNGLDMARWPINPERNSRPMQCIKTVGNIRRVKGHDVLIRAAAIVLKQFPDVRFGIGGSVLEPEFFSELQQLLRELRIDSKISFDGNITDPPAYLADADLFVLPSRSEGFSNAIIEAMAAGLPVVATDVGGNAEAVQDRITGRVVPPEDAVALAAAICRMLSDPRRAAAMGEAGRTRVADRFSTEAMMQQTTRCYRRLLKSC